MSHTDQFDELLHRGRSRPAVPPPLNNGRGSGHDRPAACPECGRELAESERAEHLVAEHSYLSLSGTLLPWDAALACLWDRVLGTGDAQSQERLLDLLGDRADGPTRPAPYVAALEAELHRRLESVSTQRRRELERLGRNLRKTASRRVNYWDLLTSTDPHVRQLGRELLLPEVGQALADEATLVEEARRWLDRLCPADDVWSKLFVCQRLARFGAAKAVIKSCLRQLQEERPVACPECGAAVPRSQLEGHLRSDHHIHQFRGVQRSLSDTLDALLALVCSPQADPEAWGALEALARESYAAEADTFLASHLGQALAALPEAGRDEALVAVADLLAVGESGSQLAVVLASARERFARHLALLLTPRLPAPLDKPLVRAMRRLLGRKRLPLEHQVAAAAALLRTSGTDGPSALKTVNAFLARWSKTRALERLRQLEQQVGPTPVLTERRAAIENRIRMSCPRCRAQLHRPEMARHLWSEHQLLLVGRRVRQPWHQLKDWLKEYRRGGDAELLVRCRTLGQYLDPEHGLRQVYRLTLAHGGTDVEARQVLLAEARQRRAALCPRCYALVPVPAEAVARPLNQSHGRLSLDGYCVDVSERGLVTRLRLETPGQVIAHGREPGRWLTRKGATLLAAGPLVGAAVALALVLPAVRIAPHWPVALCLALALAAYVAVGVHWYHQPAPLDRAVDYAWSLLAPRLHTGSFSGADAAFLAGLGLTGTDRGRAEVRAANLARLVRITENAVVGGTGAVAHLAALKRLEVADAAAAGRDPVHLVAAAVGRCLSGELPLAFAQELLAGWEDGWWTTGNLARLRVLLCDLAFEAGQEVRDLREAGRLAPVLGEVLQTDHPDGLAQLRLLWSLRPHRPWDHWGEAVTVFDLAHDAEASSRLLGKYPDLLLAEQGPMVLFICGRGVVFQDVLFKDYPRRVETKHRRESRDTNYEVLLDDHRFPFPSDPGAVVRRLERWFRYHLQEFLPRIEGVQTWKAPPGTRPLYLRRPVVCPECQSLLLPRDGDVGTLVKGVRGRRP